MRQPPVETAARATPKICYCGTTCRFLVTDKFPALYWREGLRDSYRNRWPRRLRRKLAHIHDDANRFPYESMTKQTPAVLYADTPEPTGLRAVPGVLAAVTFCHLLNDMVQSLLPSLYPILKTTFRLDFGQVGLITLTYQVTASLLQPFIGQYTDRRQIPRLLPIGMTFTLLGVVLLAVAPTFGLLLTAASFVGMGSAVFHPESSRIAGLASGGRHGLAQSIFQVGGSSGTAIGPLLAGFLVLGRGMASVAWFSVPVFLGIVVLLYVSSWYKANDASPSIDTSESTHVRPRLSSTKIAGSIAVLLLLVFSKYFYLASLTNYYTFYLISNFHVSVRSAQVHLFAFLGAVAAGTLIGGPVGDRISRKYVIWCSILGVLPFTLLLPYASLFWTGVLSVVIGFILASAFAARWVSA